MNERAERINGWAAMIGVIAAMGSYALTGDLIPGVWQVIMLLLASILLGAFLFNAILNEDVDDDDDHQGGMMIPSHNPI